MNKTLVKASVVGAAIVALAGGSTFAAWSDSGEESTGDGLLKLNLSGRDGSTIDVQPFRLAPGENQFQEFYIASADAANVSNGALSMTLRALDDIEGGGPGCTTNSEDVAEGDTGDCGAEGEFSEQATVQILVSHPVSTPGSCPNSDGHGSNSPRGTGTLASLEGVTLALGEVGPDEGVCVQAYMWLPEDATNASQGDEASWDWRFDLTQVTS